MAGPAKWRLKMEQLMACNCSWGCPCSFDSIPTYGTCEAALAYRVVDGSYGDAEPLSYRLPRTRCYREHVDMAGALGMHNDYGHAQRLGGLT